MSLVPRKTFLRCLSGGAFGALLGTARATQERGEDEILPAYDENDAETFWRAVRSRYGLQSSLTYLNTGGLGPASLPVQRVAEAVARELQRLVETGRPRFEAARAILARFLDVEVDELAFVRNATEATGIVAAGLALEPGDEVIFETHAHPGGSFPWLQQHRQRGIVVKVFEPDPRSEAGNVERVQALLTERTRVVQVSHVTAPTGLVMPVRRLADLCRARGVWFHVDGAQSAGMFPVSVSALGCDSYATSGHKWLGAPHETGVLIVRRNRIQDVQPPLVGAHSGDVREFPGPLELAPGAARFEYGTRNAAPVVALGAAAEWLGQVGLERVAARSRALIAQLRTGLRALPDVEVLTPESPELSASMLTFRSPRIGYDQLFHRLFAEHRLRCRPVSERDLNAVRVSCHLFNHPEEIDRLLEATRHILRSV